MADPEMIREIMVSFGEGLHTLGYNSPLEEIEGHGNVGKACKDARNERALKIISDYMKDLAKTFQAQPQNEPSVQKALRLCVATWEDLKQVAREP